MAADLIRYDLLVQEALRSVVRKVLVDAARKGLPGEHYFHIEFRTRAPGVHLSERMRQRFPDRMTIVLQHQFWNLVITEEAFEVGLSFGGIPETVRVPFLSLTGFFDESVQFGLRFEVEEDADADGAREAPSPAPFKGPALVGGLEGNALAFAPAFSATQDDRASEKFNGKPAGMPARKLDAKADARAHEAKKDEAVAQPKSSPRGDKPVADEAPSANSASEAEGPSPESGAKVLSIDAFRKKP